MKSLTGNSRIWKFVVVVLMCVISCPFIGDAQSTRPTRLIINCDFAQFRNTPDVGYLELYFGFSPNQLTLHQVADKFVGGVNLTVRLKSAQTMDLVLLRRYHFPVQLRDTSRAAMHNMFVSQRGFELPFGKYRFEIVAIDSFDTAHSDSIYFDDVEVSPMGNTLRGSDLELCSSVVESKDTAQLFYKNTLSVVPNPSLVFGRMNYPVVFHYLEFYNVAKDSVYTVETVVKDQAGQIKKNTSRKKRYGVKNAVEIGTMTIVNLPSGKYVYEVRILDTSQHELAGVKKYFYINNPQVKHTASAISLKAAEFLGMSNEELAGEFRSARYLATDEEVKAFSKVTSIEGRRELLAKFWSDVESGQHGQSDLNRAIYLDRVAVANQRYHAFGKDGWQTDRGRVFLLYAEPDEIERFPSGSNSKPYEIWHYNQLESGVIFVFIDRTGFGEYTLVHSTKRGELQDETWQQYLQ
jgi:GWxTD domain-containing protein